MLIMIALTEYKNIMMRKDKLMEVMIEGAGRMRKVGKRGKVQRGFERDKEEVVREILRFHGQKMGEERMRQQEVSIGQNNELYLHLDRKLHQQTQQVEITKQEQTPLNVQRQHFNEYIELSKQTKSKNAIKQLTKYEPQPYIVIDSFLKNKENVMLIQENSIKVGRGDMKSINQSTMAISKFYKPQLSPQNRKMRKTQSKPVSNANIKSIEGNSQRRQENLEYQSCIFSLSDNDASKTYNSRNDTLSNYEQVKKVSINLNLPKEKLKTSLMEIQEFQQLFDCNYQEEKQEVEERGLMEYLKNRISKGKNKPQEKISSESSSSCSFLQGKEKVTEMGISKVNNIVQQAVKNVAFNLQKQKNINEDNRVLVHQSSERDLSSNFFANLQSQPSTVQKIDDKSHDKSEMLRHLQDLKECSASLFNQKPAQQYLLEDLNSSHLSQHFQNLQAESCKNIQIDLQNMIESHKEEGVSHEESSAQPSMNSFKMEVSIDKPAEKGKNKAKRIEIDLSMSCSRHYQADNTSKEVVNLDELPNYESDEEEPVQKYSKPKAKIVLKSNNTEKHFIDGLKNDISALKSKISSNIISQESQLSFTKNPIEKTNLHPHQVYNQLKSGFSNLKRRMQQDAGLYP